MIKSSEGCCAFHIHRVDERDGRQLLKPEVESSPALQSPVGEGAMDDKNGKGGQHLPKQSESD